MQHNLHSTTYKPQSVLSSLLLNRGKLMIAFILVSSLIVQMHETEASDTFSC